jgi:malonate-semialdehyde dehydrogenase (acetylating)/methylmalonate-semialdehyde dehydrogenase
MTILEEPIKSLKIVKNYINGEWVDSKGPMLDIVNPTTMEVIGKVPDSTKEEFDSAVRAAQAAFPEWRRTTPLARSRMLFKLKELMEEHFEEVSRIQTQEHGKCIDESRGETRRGIENVEVACGIPTLMQGYYSEDIAHGLDEWVTHSAGCFRNHRPLQFPLDDTSLVRALCCGDR